MLSLQPGRLLLAALLGLVLVASGNALAAGNLVAVSGAEDNTLPIAPSALAPPECAGLTITTRAWFPASGSYYNPFSNALILGTAGNDTLDNRSTTSNTCIVFGNGNDYIDNKGSNAVVLGGYGQDTLIGATGVDRMYGGPGDDNLYGNNGDDLLYGGDGVDTIYGGSGVDELYGEAGNDFLYGEAGNDRFNGGTGTDYCEGGSGTDTFTACETSIQ